MLAHLLPCRGLHEINSTNSYVRIYKLFMQNKANLRNDKMNINAFITMRYANSYTGSGQKTKPKQTQLKPKQTQFKPNLTKGQN